MSTAICLSQQEKSVIVDLLYDRLGTYSDQSRLNAPGEDYIDSDGLILQSLLAKLDLNTECNGGGEPMVIDCDDIGECLETPINETKVINIVKKLYRTGGLSATVENTFIQQDGNVYIENHYVGGSETVPAPPTQDREPDHYDRLYGALEAVVKTINDANKDYLEVLENVSNTLELANMIAENLPIGGIGGSITAIAELADKLAEFASEQYLAYETPARLDGITCKLFCVFKDAEQVALQDIIGQIVLMAIEEGVSLDFDGIAGIDSQEAMLTWFSQAFSGTTDAIVFWVCWLQQLYFMLYQNVFFGVSSFDRLWKRFLVSYEAYPNSGWQFCLCDGGVATWSHTFDFTVSASGWRAFNPGDVARAVYHTGDGWGRSAGTTNRLQIELIATPTLQLTRVEVYANQTYTLPASQSNATMGIQQVGAWASEIVVNGGTIQLINNHVLASPTDSNERVLFTIASNNTPGTTNAIPSGFRITKITLYGNGTNPFV